MRYLTGILALVGATYLLLILTSALMGALGIA